MYYKKYLVLFIDVLGSKGREDFEELYKINTTFHNSLEEYKEEDKSSNIYSREVHTFSDCAYIFYYFKDDIIEEKKNLGKLFKVALHNTQFLILELLSNGFLCRGGVTFGKAYFEDDRSLLFGPAVNKAYYLEEKVAEFPRILIDNFVANKVLDEERKLLNGDNIPEHKKEYIKKINGEIVISDEDGKYHLNYLNLMNLGHNYETNNGMNLIELNSFCKDFALNEIKKYKNKINNEKNKRRYKKIIRKQNWFLEYVKNSSSNTKNNTYIFRD